MKNHPIWPDFVAWAKREGVSTDHEDDWKPWWECFLSGSLVGVKAAAMSITAPLHAELEHLNAEVRKLGTK